MIGIERKSAAADGGVALAQAADDGFAGAVARISFEVCRLSSCGQSELHDTQDPRFQSCLISFAGFPAIMQ